MDKTLEQTEATLYLPLDDETLGKTGGTTDPLHCEVLLSAKPQPLNSDPNP